MGTSQINKEIEDQDPAISGEGMTNFTGYGIDYAGTQRERRESDPHVTFNAPPPFLYDHEYHELVARVPIEYETQGLSDVDNMGIKPYMATLEVIQEILARRLDSEGSETE